MPAWLESPPAARVQYGGSSVTSRTVNSYQWWDSAVQSSISHKPNISQSTTYTTSFYLNNFGQLTGAYIADGKARSVSFTLDELGQIIRRDETRPYNAPSGQTGSPHEVWYRFGGRQLGYTGNNGTSEVTYEASINERRTVAPTDPGTYRNGQLYGASYADFAQNYDPINSYYQGSAGGSYRVQQGDTLQGIAQSIYGDASLWYKIAEANGLSAGTGLIEGQTLILPTGVTKSKFNAGTAKAYNPGEAIGDLSPTMAKPPKKNKCGVFGQILLAVIAIAVTALTYGALGGAALTGWSAVGAGALAGAAGSVASQAVGVATGIQDKFSFKGVALAAIGGAISGGLGPKGLFGADGAFSKVGSQFVGDVLRGAVGSAATQGIGVATGLQDKFSWAGVAAAGIGAGIGGALGRSIDGKSFLGQTINKGDFGYTLATATASGIANAATRSALNGESFGDNLMAALPDIIGQAVGGAAGRWLYSLIDQPEEQVVVQPTEEKSVPVGQVAAQAVINNLPPQQVAGITAMGGRLVALPDGRIKVEGISSSTAQPAATPTGESGPVIRTGRDGANGIIVANSDGLAFVDTQRASWQTDVSPVDLGGLNFEFAPGFGSVASIWVAEGGGGAVRILANETSAFLYTGGEAIFPELGVRVSYGAQLSQNLLAGYFTSSAPAANDNQLSGWQRAGAAGWAAVHGVGTVLSGAGAVATSELCATGIGCVVPIAFGAGAVFEADNFQTQFRRAWTGREATTLGSTAISNVFNVTPQRADQIYGSIQLVTGLTSGAGSYRAFTSGFVISESAAAGSLVRGGISEVDALKYVSSFDGPIRMRLAGGPGQSLLRYTDDATSKGSFLTNMRFSTPDEAVRGLYLQPYGNNATLVQQVTNPIPRPVLSGGIAGGDAGATQFVIRYNDRWRFSTGTGY